MDSVKGINLKQVWFQGNLVQRTLWEICLDGLDSQGKGNHGKEKRETETTRKKNVKQGIVNEIRVFLNLQVCMDVDGSQYNTLPESSNLENGEHSEYEGKKTTWCKEVKDRLLLKMHAC